MPGRRACCFLVPGDWHTPTGGYTYDRRLVQALRAAGWAVQTHRLDGDWPWPDAAALAVTRTCVEALTAGSLVVADGLAFGALPGFVQRHAERLRWVALVHHPLHMETGLDETMRHDLHRSEEQALQGARQVVVTSRSTAQDVAAMAVPPDRIAVVEPGTDPMLPPRGDGGTGGTGRVRLLCVAALIPRKGHAVLLQALAGLAGQDWVLHNVGSATRDAQTAARLHAMSMAAELAGRVFWHGAVDAAALRAQYAAADVFVLPSLHEGYGMAVAEALAFGLPVLASSAGALAQTLPADAGLHVPPGDAIALRTALAQLMADPGLRARLAA
ncbi:MAG: glycosyltransferase family 4 protein, partial [Rubrivivax sp.]|nr:glycosyltransferase family 4 protein [Rubrivivax sp.]